MQLVSEEKIVKHLVQGLCQTTKKKLQGKYASPLSLAGVFLEKGEKVLFWHCFSSEVY
jgi:hypothetical protein